MERLRQTKLFCERLRRECAHHWGASDERMMAMVERRLDDALLVLSNETPSAVELVHWHEMAACLEEAVGALLPLYRARAQADEADQSLMMDRMHALTVYEQ